MSAPKRRSPAERFLRFLVGVDPIQEVGSGLGDIYGKDLTTAKQLGSAIGNQGLNIGQTLGSGIAGGAGAAGQGLDWLFKTPPPQQRAITARDEDPQSSRTTKPYRPKTAREKKQQNRQINLRRQMWESLGVDPSVARVMAGADVAQMRSRQQNQADEEAEGTLPGTAPPPLDDVGWQPLEEAATETDNMNTIDLFQTVLNAGGQGFAPVGEYWLSEEDVADFLTGNGRPLPGYSAEETEIEIRNALNEQLNMLESGLITPENPSIAPVQPRQYGEDEGNESWLGSALGYTPQGQVLSDVQNWFGEGEDQPRQDETEEAPPTPQVDVNALSEEDKEALYQVIAPMWSTYTDEEMPPRDELIALFFDTWYTQESAQ